MKDSIHDLINGVFGSPISTPGRSYHDGVMKGFELAIKAASLIAQEESRIYRPLLVTMAEHFAEPCRLDHEGFCQEHLLCGPPCAIATLKAYLGRDEDTASRISKLRLERKS